MEQVKIFGRGFGLSFVQFGHRKEIVEYIDQVPHIGLDLFQMGQTSLALVGGVQLFDE